MTTKKHLIMNGDSGGSKPSGKTRPSGSMVSTKGSIAGSNIYKHIVIGEPVGTPSVSKARMIKAVRTVMKEDGMI